MTSREECNEAYRYLGYNGYDNTIPKEEFEERVKQMTPTTSKERMLLMNAQRCFNITHNAKTQEEADQLSQEYFDKVDGYEQSMKGDFPYEIAVLEIIKHGVQIDNTKSSKTIYGFQPLIRGSPLYRKKRNQGYILVKKRHLSSRIRFEYLPENVRNNNILKHIWFLVPTNYTKSTLNTVEKSVIEAKNKEIYSLSGKLCYSKPEWGYWGWFFPWKTYGAWTNWEKTEWDWVAEEGELMNNINQKIE